VDTLIDKVIPIQDASSEVFYGNIRDAMKRDLPWQYQLPGWGQPKNDAVALMGGGPSLAVEIKKINFSGAVVACGSVHDYLVEQAIPFDYAIFCDPSPVVLQYIKKPQKTTTYLVATCCDPSVFEHLKDYTVYRWHCFNDDIEAFKAIDANFSAIGGGCTVGLRALTMMMMLGYRDFHMFGFDSCLKSGDSYAYPLADGDVVSDKVYKIKLDPKSDKYYDCLGYHMAQVDNFKDYTAKYYDYFRCWFHGGGLMAEMYDLVDMQIRAGKLRSLYNKRTEANG